MNFKCYIDSSYIYNQNLTDSDIAIYLILQPLMDKSSEFTFVSVDMVERRISQSSTRETRRRGIIRNSLNSLINNDIIKGTKCNVNLFHIDSSFSSIRPSGRFITVNTEHIDKIIGSATKVRLLCAIILSFDWRYELGDARGKVGHMSQLFFSNKLNISINTISNYFKEFEMNDILYVYHSRYNSNSSATNCYGYIEDQDLIDQFAINNNRKRRTQHYVEYNTENIDEQYKQSTSHKSLTYDAGTTNNIISYENYFNVDDMYHNDEDYDDIEVSDEDENLFG